MPAVPQPRPFPDLDRQLEQTIYFTLRVNININRSRPFGQAGHRHDGPSDGDHETRAG